MSWVMLDRGLRRLGFNHAEAQPSKTEEEIQIVLHDFYHKFILVV